MKKLKIISIFITLMFCLVIVNSAFTALDSTLERNSSAVLEKGYKEYTTPAAIMKSEKENTKMKEVRNSFFKDFMNIDYCEYDPDKKIAKVRSNSGNEFIIKGISEKKYDILVDKLFYAENQEIFENALKEYSGNFYCENIKIGSKEKNEDANFLCIQNKAKNGTVISYTLLDEFGNVRGILPVKGMSKEQKKSLIREAGVVNLLTNLIKKAENIIKENTYYKIRQTKNSLKIPNKKGKTVATIDTKGMTKKQIKGLKNYYNKYILNKSSKDKSVQKALKNLKKKASKIRKANKLNNQIKKRYGKIGLKIVNSIAGSIWHSNYDNSRQFVFNKLKKNKISKTQLKKLYMEFNTLNNNDYIKYNDPFSVDTDRNLKRAIFNVRKGISTKEL